MGGVLDFLFEGRPPASVTTYGTTQQNVPSWLSDYTQGLIARANSVAAEPYQSYQGPRVAGFSPFQTQAQNMTKENVGAWSPYTDAAKTGYQGVLGSSYTDQVEKYMNPYVDNVIDRSTEIAQRKLQEQLMPAINSNFLRAGTYGSAGQQRAVGQALRDVTGEVQSQARGALSDAYTQGADQYGREMSQQLQASQGLGGLGQMIQSLRGTDAASLAAAGGDQQALTQRNLDLAYQDFQNQRDFPLQRVGWMSDIIRGIPNMGGTTQTQSTGPAESYGPSGISQLASLYSLYRGIKDEWGKNRGGLARYARGGKVATVTRVAELLSQLTDSKLPEKDKRRISAQLIGARGKLASEKGISKERAERLGTLEYARLMHKARIESRDATKHARGGLATMRRISNGR